MHSLSPDSVEMLKRLTQDRGELMGTLRDRYLAAQVGLDNEAPETIFAVTLSLARQVYFLHHLVIRYFGSLEFLTEEEMRHA